LPNLDLVGKIVQSNKSTGVIDCIEKLMLEITHLNNIIGTLPLGNLRIKHLIILLYLGYSMFYNKYISTGIFDRQELGIFVRDIQRLRVELYRAGRDVYLGTSFPRPVGIDIRGNLMYIDDTVYTDDDDDYDAFNILNNSGSEL
jgi:hypothetical protein